MSRRWLGLVMLCSVLSACGDDSAQSNDDLGVTNPDGAMTGADLSQPPAMDCPTSADATTPSLGAETMKREDVKVGGIFAERYVWKDADGRVRSLALKRQCSGNSGNGGYVIQMTYQLADATTRTLGADDSNDGGFGYFVSHEAYRHFSDGTDGDIAGVHGEDGSPLGKGFPTTAVSTVTATTATHVVSQTYPHWGTKDASAYDDNTGQIPAPADKTQHVRYDLPITMTWSFAAGTNYPLVRTQVDQSMVPGADRVFFDVRGPYGVLGFDEDKGLTIQGVFWGDRANSFHNIAVPLTWKSGGDWSGAAPGARYHALVAGDYEMGLYEPVGLASTPLADSYSDNRGKPAATLACADDTVNLKLPCEGEWPYQSLNYSLDRGTPTTPTDGHKIAWGSSPFYGSSLTTVAASPTVNEPITATGTIRYDLCLVVDKPVAAQGADGASTIQSKTAQVANDAAKRSSLCAVLP